MSSCCHLRRKHQPAFTRNKANTSVPPSAAWAPQHLPGRVEGVLQTAYFPRRPGLGLPLHHSAGLWLHHHRLRLHPGHQRLAAQHSDGRVGFGRASGYCAFHKAAQSMWPGQHWGHFQRSAPSCLLLCLCSVFAPGSPMDLSVLNMGNASNVGGMTGGHQRHGYPLRGGSNQPLLPDRSSIHWTNNTVLFWERASRDWTRVLRLHHPAVPWSHYSSSWWVDAFVLKYKKIKINKQIKMYTLLFQFLGLVWFKKKFFQRSLLCTFNIFIYF